jgi:hypothetical protein
MRILLLLLALLFSAGRPAVGEDAPIGLDFAGYPWVLKRSNGHVGAGPNRFGAEGVRVDGRGHLHLKIAGGEGRWVCSEVILERSFGYGLYRFVVQETSQIDVKVAISHLHSTEA